MTLNGYEKNTIQTSAKIEFNFIENSIQVRKLCDTYMFVHADP